VRKIIIKVAIVIVVIVALVYLYLVLAVDTKIEEQREFNKKIERDSVDYHSKKVDSIRPN
jgi:hypothetical protein